MTVRDDLIVREALNDIAMIIGGPRQLDEGLLWSICKRMDRVRVRMFRELSGLTEIKYQPDSIAHTTAYPPAVREFIVRNNSRNGE